MRAVLALALAALLAPAAAADIGIVGVSPTRARPGDLVRVRAYGWLGPRPWRAMMPVVLVRTERMPRPYACDGGTAICEPIVWRGRLEREPYHVVGLARRWRGGRKLPDGMGETVVRFHVPRVPSGRYRLALWCGPCVRGPQGSLIAGPTLTVY